MVQINDTHYAYAQGFKDGYTGNMTSDYIKQLNAKLALDSTQTDLTYYYRQGYRCGEFEKYFETLAVPAEGVAA